SRRRAALPDPVRRLNEKIRARAGSKELLESLLDGLAGGDGPAGAVLGFAVAVGTPAVDVLVRALHRGAPPALHRRICDAIIAISPETAVSVIDRLDVDQPDVAVDAAHL